MEYYLIRRRKRQQAKRKLTMLFGSLILLSVITFLIINTLRLANSNASARIISPQISQPTMIPSATPNIDKKLLPNIVQNTLKETKGTYGIVIKNLKTGETYMENEHQIFEPGSLYKLWVMAATYEQVSQDKLKLDQTLSENVTTLNQKFNIDPEDAELKTGTITYTIENALTQMITISHNYAALILTAKLRLSYIAEFLQKNGFNESTVGTTGKPPSATPSDIGLFLEKLYQGKLANPEYTDKMIALLKQQKLNNKLPKYLPPNTEIAHKTGELGTFSHDVGIVYTPNGDYLIVIFSDSPTPAKAEEAIAKVSQAVYDYFEN